MKTERVKVTEKNVPELPKQPGLYQIYLDGACIYIGETRNLYTRILQHFNSLVVNSTLLGKLYASEEFKPEDIWRVEIEYTFPLGRKRFKRERKLISKKDPPLNVINRKERSSLSEGSDGGINPLRKLIWEIEQEKDKKGYEKASFTYPKSWRTLLKKLKKIGEQEGRRKNLSLMINVALLDFIYKYESSGSKNLEQRLQTLKEEQKQEETKEEQKQERETEEKENGEKEENRKLVQTKQTEEREQYKKYVKALKYVQHYMDTGKFEKAQAVINDIPLDKLRKQHRKMVQNWQETLQKHLQQLEEPIQLRELSEKDNDVELKPLSVADRDEIFGEEYLKYKKRIVAAEKQLEQGNRTKAKTLVENLNITDAPGDRLEYRLRKLKEELGVKY